MSALRVLTYHRILGPTDAEATDPSLVSASPSVFDRQMRHLAEHYRPIRAEEALNALRGGRPLPERAILVTFDDAYRDFAEIAWPILRRHGIPATVFVPTAYPDHPEREFWWDRLYRAFALSQRAKLELAPLGSLPLFPLGARRASLRTVQNRLKRIPHAEAMSLVDRICGELGEPTPPSASPPLSGVLSWDELRALAREGVTLCAHTRTHPALDQLPIGAARDEIRGSHDDLRREIGSALPIFAYPFGAHSDPVVEVVRQAGFELALTCLDGHNRVPFRKPLRLRRTNITMRTSPLIFALRLLRAVSYVDRWRHRPRRS